jgi:hypothetical protein
MPTTSLPGIDASDGSNNSLAEFFEEIEKREGAALTADDHRALVAAVRADRERPED